jgi:signal transduction histidine kinase
MPMGKVGEWFLQGTQLDIPEIRAWKRRSLDHILYLALAFGVVNLAVAPMIYEGFALGYSVVAFLVPVIGIILNRYDYVATSAVFCVSSLTVSTITYTVSSGLAHVTMFLIAGIFVFAVVLSLRLTLLLVATDLAALIVLSQASLHFTFLPREWDVARSDYLSTAFAFLIVAGVAVALGYDYIKHLYQEVTVARDGLEKKVQERTRQIQAYQEQLMQSQKMESLGRLSAGVAHDFNNILMSVLGHASVGAIQGGDDPEVSRRFASIETAATKGKEFTDKLLGFSRREQSQLEVLDVNDIVRESAGIVARTVRRDVTINHAPSDPVYVRCDRSQIEQVILNILLNARDAIESAGSIDITVDTQEVDPSEVPELEAGTYARVAVRDTGKGMSDATRNRVFEPFFTTKERGKGTGLGLSIAYGIVRNLGGSIDAESSPGKGAVFTIRLPVSKEAPAPPEPKPEMAAPPRTATVMVVDDEEDLCGVTADMLKIVGYGAFKATSGREALEVFQRERAGVDAVLLDISMPDMSGEVVFEKLREIDPRVKVVVCSGYGLEEEIERMQKSGARGLLRKPYTVSALSRKLEEVLT